MILRELFNGLQKQFLTTSHITDPTGNNPLVKAVVSNTEDGNTRCSYWKFNIAWHAGGNKKENPKYVSLNNKFTSTHILFLPFCSM